MIKRLPHVLPSVFDRTYPLPQFKNACGNLLIADGDWFLHIWAQDCEQRPFYTMSYCQVRPVAPGGQIDLYAQFRTAPYKWTLTKLRGETHSLECGPASLNGFKGLQGWVVTVPAEVFS